jgi:hypothetical protein
MNKGKFSTKVIIILGLSAVFISFGVILRQSGVSAASGDISDSYVWKPLTTGAGGFITGIDIHPNGNTRFAITDTYGVYRWTGTSRKQILTFVSMPADDVDFRKSGGVLDVTSAPDDENRAYMAFRGYVYRSDNKGDRWTKTSGPNTAMEANDNGVECRVCNNRLLVDPANREVVYFGSQNDGLFRSDNGGANWSRVGSVPAGQHDNPGAETAKGRGVFVAVDKNSVQNGRAQKIYVSSHRNGVYFSTDGGFNFSPLGNSPGAIFTNLIVSNDGAVFVTTEDQGIYRYKNGAWQQLPGTLIPLLRTIAGDPNNPNRLYALDDGGRIIRSVNGGDSSQTDISFSRRAEGDIPWLAWTNESYMSTAEIVFDPVRPNRIWFAEGIGVWYADVNDADASIVWRAESRGIEQLVGTDVIAPPSGKPVTASWDRATFYHENLDQRCKLRHCPKSLTRPFRLVSKKKEKEKLC